MIVSILDRDDGERKVSVACVPQIGETILLPIQNLKTSASPVMPRRVYDVVHHPQFHDWEPAARIVIHTEKIP